jgi:MraZ protein
MLSQANDVRAGGEQGSAARIGLFPIRIRNPTRHRQGKADQLVMSQFLGTHQNRLDAKSRVSIPAPFRSVLRTLPASAAPDTASLVLRPSHTHDCIEVWPATVFHALETSLERYDPLSESYDDFALALYGDAYPVDADKEGRIVLSDDLKAHAHLTDSVSFIGLGRTFQIWQPELALARRTQARESARIKGMTAQFAAPAIAESRQ